MSSQIPSERRAPPVDAALWGDAPFGGDPAEAAGGVVDVGIDVGVDEADVDAIAARFAAAPVTSLRERPRQATTQQTRPTRWLRPAFAVAAAAAVALFAIRHTQPPPPDAASALAASADVRSAPSGVEDAPEQRAAAAVGAAAEVAGGAGAEAGAEVDAAHAVRRPLTAADVAVTQEGDPSLALEGEVFAGFGAATEADLLAMDALAVLDPSDDDLLALYYGDDAF